MLAQLYAKEGDQIGYLYDFGDKWFHEIEVRPSLLTLINTQTVY